MKEKNPITLFSPEYRNMKYKTTNNIFYFLHSVYAIKIRFCTLKSNKIFFINHKQKRVYKYIIFVHDNIFFFNYDIDWNFLKE